MMLTGAESTRCWWRRRVSLRVWLWIKYKLAAQYFPIGSVSALLFVSGLAGGVDYVPSFGENRLFMSPQERVALEVEPAPEPAPEPTMTLGETEPLKEIRPAAKPVQPRNLTFALDGVVVLPDGKSTLWINGKRLEKTTSSLQAIAVNRLGESTLRIYDVNRELRPGWKLSVKVANGSVSK